MAGAEVVGAVIPTESHTRTNPRAILMLSLATTAILLSPLATTAQAAPVEIQGNCVYVLPGGARVGPVYTSGAWVCSEDDLPGAPSIPQCVYLLPGGAKVGPVFVTGPYVCTLP